MMQNTSKDNSNSQQNLLEKMTWFRVGKDTQIQAKVNKSSGRQELTATFHVWKDKNQEGHGIPLH